jgi:hypothetical protein
MRRLLSLSLLALSFRVAGAEPYRPKPPPPPIDMALASNAHGWLNESFALSLYTGVSKHHALRANFASYRYQPPLWSAAISLAAFAEDEGEYAGRTTDWGLGWIYYPRRLFDGFNVELGALRRARNNGESGGFESDFRTTDTTTYAGRAMVGWSWLFESTLFVALGAGMSIGHESGSQLIDEDDPARPDQMHSIDRTTYEVEAYARLGFAFQI